MLRVVSSGVDVVLYSLRTCLLSSASAIVCWKYVESVEVLCSFFKGLAHACVGNVVGLLYI